MKISELFEAMTPDEKRKKMAREHSRRYRSVQKFIKDKEAKKAAATARGPITDEQRREVYDIMSAEGPDVDMWSPKFGRLVGQAKTAGVLGDKKKLFKWLEDKGMFGPKSDRLRGEGDKYYSAQRESVNESVPAVHDLSHHEDGSGAYDETQTNDDIKDGDVLNLGKGRTGVMVKAWPVSVTGDHSGTHFHKLAKGVTWDDFEGGKYKEAAKRAQQVAGVKEGILSETKKDSEGEKLSRLADQASANISAMSAVEYRKRGPKVEKDAERIHRAAAAHHKKMGNDSMYVQHNVAANGHGLMATHGFTK